MPCPSTPDAAAVPGDRGGVRRPAAPTAGRAAEPAAGDGVDLPRRRRGRLRPLRQPDLGDVRERGRRARGRAWRRRSPPGWPPWRRCSTWCRRAASWCAGPDAYYGSLTAAAAAARQQGRLPVRRSTSPTPPRSAAAVQGADLVWAETPTNPHAQGGRPRGAGARCGRGRRAAASSTAPSRRRSCSGRSRLGADVVVHSATKYLSGHSDLLLGVAVAHDADAGRPAGRAPRHAGRRARAPFEAWLALRGLRTLHLRVERAQANAAELARRLARPPGGGPGPLPGLRRDGERRARPATPQTADAVVRASTRLWVHATSLGGVESTLERRRRWPGESADVPETPAPAVGRHRGRRGPVARPRRRPRPGLTPAAQSASDFADAAHDAAARSRRAAARRARPRRRAR